MSSAILVDPSFDATWPFAADHWRSRWEAQGPTRLVRAGEDTEAAVTALWPDGRGVTRLAALGVPGLLLLASALGRLRR